MKYYDYVDYNELYMNIILLFMEYCFDFELF